MFVGAIAFGSASAFVSMAACELVAPISVNAQDSGVPRDAPSATDSLADSLPEPCDIQCSHDFCQWQQGWSSYVIDGGTLDANPTFSCEPLFAEVLDAGDASCATSNTSAYGYGSALAKSGRLSFRCRGIELAFDLNLLPFACEEPLVEPTVVELSLEDDDGGVLWTLEMAFSNFGEHLLVQKGHTIAALPLEGRSGSGSRHIFISVELTDDGGTASLSVDDAAVKGTSIESPSPPVGSLYVTAGLHALRTDTRWSMTIQNLTLDTSMCP